MNDVDGGRGDDRIPFLPAFVPPNQRAGFRLRRLEIYNWGTFHERVWALDLGGDNVLLTGDIGSGKSTLVDAVTTLLVPPQKIAYNKAAGAEARERTLRSYVLGHYKAERGDSGFSARPVSLRDHNTYSVVLGCFCNEALQQSVTLAQVFWFRDTDGQPVRLFVVADDSLSVVDHFAGFGSEVAHLRKRLRKAPGVAVVEDTFPPYGAAFRQRFGIGNEQALELFHQTVSMKSVGNLTDFVRQHMLEASAIEPRIGALLGHFENLSRAHEAVLKAKAQIDRLAPIVADCLRHAEVAAEAAALRACREALHPWFMSLKHELLEKRLAHLDAETARLDGRIEALVEKRNGQRKQREDITRDIAANGGDRIERLKGEIARCRSEIDARQKRVQTYDGIVHALGLPPASDGDTFIANRRTIAAARETAENRRADVQNALTEAAVEFRQRKTEHDEIAREIASLRQRRSNIPARILDLRKDLCRALNGVPEDDLPFAGELIRVREDERDWEGAIERVLHNFGLSLLVVDALYPRVAQWVDRTYLGGRLVYFRIRASPATDRSPHSHSLVRKVALKPDSGLDAWLDSELTRRFDYACCDDIEQFRREPRAMTRAGQIKGGERHEKDDRHRIDDRSRYVLGWSNEAKIAALEEHVRGLEISMQRQGADIGHLEEERRTLQDRLGKLDQLVVFESFRDLDWKPLAIEVQRLEDERQQLESGSDVLRRLEGQLQEVESALDETEEDLDDHKRKRTETAVKAEQARDHSRSCEESLAATADDVKATLFPRLEDMRTEALGAHTLTIESCENREKDMRDWIQAKIDAEDSRKQRLAGKIVEAMAAYRKDYPLETQEADASVEAASEYAAMLERLQSDDLPRFERRFKELLNENTIREMANFQSQLYLERQTMRERIEVINKSLREIDYNPGRYIALEPAPSGDLEIRDFQQDLRACTEGTLTGSEDDAYSEAKFLQVQRIIERLRGRDGTTEIDRRWTRKVTDVRNWFTFSASERWREDDREHEHYADSGGKSGGQKEKLAYTVLAASLAYQFGLEWGATRSRSFRFVVIDEAFGRGSDESARYGLDLFQKLKLQLLIVTPLQKIHIIEPYVAGVGFVHTEDGRLSMLRNLTIDEYRAELAARTA